MYHQQGLRREVKKKIYIAGWELDNRSKLSDETLLLIDEFKAKRLEIPVVVSKNRYKGAAVCSVDDIYYNLHLKAHDAEISSNSGINEDIADVLAHCIYDKIHDKYEEYKKIAILDDGFTALNIRKNINILLIDGTKNIFDQFPIPAGTLREPLSAVRFCDCFVITKSIEKNRFLESNIRRFNTVSPIFYSYYSPKILKGGLDGGETIPLKDLRGKSVITISAIGNPEYFYKNLGDCGMIITDILEFKDHYAYGEKDMMKLKEVLKSGKDGSVIAITTSKDYVKLREYSPKYSDILNRLYYLDFDLKVDSSFYDYILTAYKEYLKKVKPHNMHSK